jgi:PhoD-like phosphatase
VADLVLGPMVRHAGGTEATVWMEADAPCAVSVLGREERTFAVGGRHFAVVALEGLAAGAPERYEVHLDGVRRWPPPGSAFPPSVVRPLPGGARLRLVVGSCRVAAPERAPYTASPDEDRRGLGPDALRALARELLRTPAADWPDLMLLLGDQVYVDAGSPETRRFIRAQRATRARLPVPVDFEEHARLYREAWSDPGVRWLLSTVPSAMIFDDHEVHEGWNVSAGWLRERRRSRRWSARAASAIAAYWCYQHLGNLTPAELRADPLLAEVRSAPDGLPALASAACATARGTGPRFSFSRELGPARLVVPDARSRRVLNPRARSMLDGPGWESLEGELRGDVDHLLLASSIPVFLPAGLHDLEAWSEALGAGTWGARGVALGERLQRRLSLEHWAAFGRSFDRLLDRLSAVAAGAHGPAPASIVVLTGDIHHGSLTRVRFPPGSAERSPVWQLVSSPLRNPLGRGVRARLRIGGTRTFAAAMRLVARAAGVPRRPARWRRVGPLVFANHVATVAIDGPRAWVAIDAALPSEDGGGLRRVLRVQLAGAPRGTPRGGGPSGARGVPSQALATSRPPPRHGGQAP